MLILDKAGWGDCFEIHRLQIAAFKELLIKYKDREINPGAETVGKVIWRMEQPSTDYYFITLDGKHIGAIRIVDLGNGKMRIANMFILPEFQGKGYAQQVIKSAEGLYSYANVWELDTIKQESKLCHLYEKMGYERTGREEFIQDGMTIVFYEKHLK